MINTLNHILTKYQTLTNLTFNIHIFILLPSKKIIIKTINKPQE